MTVPATAKGLGGRLPSEQEREAANRLRQLLAERASGQARLKLIDPETEAPVDITLAPALSDLLMEVLRHVGNGDSVTLVPYGQMLTTQQAADILNVSRPFLITLLEKQEIPFITVGRHRRIRATDLFAYKEARDDRRGRALEALAEIDGQNL